jgi:hypothetical protein
MLFAAVAKRRIALERAWAFPIFELDERDLNGPALTVSGMNGDVAQSVTIGLHFS